MEVGLVVAVAVADVVVVVAFSKLVGGTHTAPLGNKEPEDIDLQGNPWRSRGLAT